MQRGLALPVAEWRETIDIALASADAGVTSVWFIDDRDPVPLAGALAQAVPQQRIGVLAERMSDRPPVLSIKQLQTLDHITGGRLIIGVSSVREAMAIEAGMQAHYRPLSVQKPCPSLWLFDVVPESGGYIAHEEVVPNSVRARFAEHPSDGDLRSWSNEGVEAALFSALDAS